MKLSYKIYNQKLKLINRNNLKKELKYHIWRGYI